MKWSVVYEKAIRDDGTLFFPEKLSYEVLEQKKRVLGSYIFANQYLNEIIPSELQTFKREWFRYYSQVPANRHTFIHIDPAISEADTADYTGVVVVHMDAEKNWYVQYARRYKITPTEIVSLLFELNHQFKPNRIGIEDVAYQKALLYFLNDEMRRRNIILPVTGVTPPNNQSKQMRILSMVPRMEWGHIFLNQGLADLELEFLQFPRGAHDDLIDSLAAIEHIAFPPEKEKLFAKKPAPNHPDYEKWLIHQMRTRTDDQGDLNDQY